MLTISPYRPALRGVSVVAGAFVLDLIGFGAIYSHAAFAEDIAASFSAARGAVTLTFALATATCFFVGAVSGPLADRFGARWPALAGMLMLALGLVAAARAESLLELHLGYGVLVGIGAGLAHVPAMAAVQRRFVRRRGLASGIAACGVGFGIVLVPPLSEVLLAVGTWRSAFLTCGLLAAFAGVMAALLLPGAPSDPAVLRHRAPPAPRTGASRRKALATAYAGTLLISFAVNLPFVLLVGTARDLGVGRHEAVALVGIIGIGTLLGRMVVAAIADRVGRREMFLACCAGLALSMALWPVAAEHAALEVFAVAFGVLQGGFVSLLPPFVADRFGADALGRKLGIFFTSRAIALLCAPPAVVAAAGLSGTMTAPLLAVAALAGIGTAMLAAVGGASGAGATATAIRSEANGTAEPVAAVSLSEPPLRLSWLAPTRLAPLLLAQSRAAMAAILSQMVRPPMREPGVWLHHRPRRVN